MATTNQIRLMAVLAVTCVLAGYVGVFVVPPKVVQATFPGQNGKIAYSGFDGNDYEIYTINPTGGTPFQVTDNNVDDRRPSYSPDGNKIAYESGWQIYTIDATGGTPVRLTDVIKGAASWPDYSPDGNKIAYSAYSGNDEDIYTIDSSGGTPVNVTNNDDKDDRRPSYSPDGNKIAYASSRHDQGTASWQIYTMDSSGGTPFQVTNNQFTGYMHPSYSPDGNKIAYEGSDGNDLEIYTIDSSGGTPSQVTDNSTHDTLPSYSPDGNKIAFANSGAIYTIDSSGGTPFQVTDNSAEGWSAPSWGIAVSEPPTNDAFDSAQQIGGNDTSVSGTTERATREEGEPDHYTSNPEDADWWEGDHTVWYRWTAPASGSTTIDTCQANIDSILAVYTGSELTALNRVADNNNDHAYCPDSWGSKVTFDATAGTTYHIAVGDAGGLRESTFTLTLSQPDTTKPSTNAIRSVEPNAAGWNKANVTVSLKATDNQGGSGVQKITYSASGAQTIAQADATGDSVELALDQQGTTTLTYYATDKAGNVEDQKTLTVKIDKSAPTGRVTINDGASRTRSRSATLSLSATDPSPGSGVSQMRISNTQSGLSSASWEAYSTTKAWTLSSGKGTKTVYVQYRDRAEYNSAVVTDTIKFAR